MDIENSKAVVFLKHFAKNMRKTTACNIKNAIMLSLLPLLSR
ncbi:hypothetical protein X781_3380 [Mannheimia sp. USDA-ARS-USMARC-1261]|nr:hypothetical protein X781_3380 [Mannheimia sp. USDA-ARS-USMARC-1261]